MNALASRLWEVVSMTHCDSQDNMNVNMEVEHEQIIFIAADADVFNVDAALLAHKSMIILIKEYPGMP